MKVCPSCNFRNLDTRSRCLKCDTVLDHQPKAVKKVRRRHDGIIVATQRQFRKAGSRIRRTLSSQLPTDVPYRYPWLAGALALLPGAGQLYNRQYKKAVLVVLGHTMIAAIAIITIRNRLSNVVLAGWVLYILYCYNDAVVSSTKINGQHWTARHILALFTYLLFIVGIVAIVLQFFISPVFKLVYISQDVLAPQLREGDRVLVECVSYWFRAPKRGEIIYYDPDRYTIEIPGTMGGTTYAINEKRSFERISGIAGDRVENKDGVLTFNGEPMPKEYVPLKTTELPANFTFDVPEERYLAIISHSTQEESILGLGGVSPRLNAGVILKGWDKACIIEKKQIIGRTLLIYYPPMRRCSLLPP